MAEQTISGFRPSAALSDPHLQTLGAAVLRRYPGPPLQRERIELSDGDFLDLDWTLTGRGPLLLVLHGLAGCSGSNYVGGILKAACSRGWRGVAMHFRGCSGEPNRLAKSYSAGDTDDLHTVLALLRARYREAPLFAVGYSLGGNVLLKWLGETADDRALAGAVAVSVPFQLAHAAERMQRGLSRFYQTYLLRRLCRAYRQKFAGRDDAPIPIEHVTGLNNFWRFDHEITAPLHGYTGVMDYYQRASCRGYLGQIRTPTLLLHARDDPFMLPETAPTLNELSDFVTLELSDRGGHVGFVEGLPWQPRFWLERRIPAFFERRLRELEEPSVAIQVQREPERLSR